MQYKKEATTGIEECGLKVIKGVATDNNPVIPQHTLGDILSGDLLNEMPLYKVSFDGLNMSPPIALFRIIPSYEMISEECLSSVSTQIEEAIGALNANQLNSLNAVLANTQTKRLVDALVIKHITELIGGGKIKLSWNETKQGVDVFHWVDE